MISLLLALAAQLPAPAPASREIVVTGQRMTKVLYAVRIRQKTREADCWIHRSSGDPRIDW